MLNTSTIMTSSSDWSSGDEIRVYIGKEEKKFLVSRKQLQPVLPHIQLENFKSHHLPDVDERTFELFEHWLDKKTLDELDPDDEQEAKHRMLEYLELYFEVDEWEIPDLQNDIMDRFRGRQTCEDGYFPAFLISKIYENTEEGAPLRRYIVNSFLYKSADWFSNQLDPIFEHQVEKGNTAFLLDCYKAALALANGKIHDAEVEDGEDPGCEYHIHKEGKECKSELARKRRKIG